MTIYDLQRRVEQAIKLNLGDKDIYELKVEQPVGNHKRVLVVNNELDNSLFIVIE